MSDTSQNAAFNGPIRICSFSFLHAFSLYVPPSRLPKTSKHSHRLTCPTSGSSITAPTFKPTILTLNCHSTQPAKQQHKFSSDDIKTSSSQRVHDFMRTVNEGGDPITALSFRAPVSSQQAIAAHRARAQRNIDESIAKFRGQRS
ncbi:hypothetical protein DL767_001937 [Monosporascus sp. MG133]|nr:hypothetical protein DL767_001937 [Monosporascus sp. MG133]